MTPELMTAERGGPSGSGSATSSDGTRSTMRPPPVRPPAVGSGPELGITRVREAPGRRAVAAGEEIESTTRRDRPAAASGPLHVAGGRFSGTRRRVAAERWQARTRGTRRRARYTSAGDVELATATRPARSDSRFGGWSSHHAIRPSPHPRPVRRMNGRSAPGSIRLRRRAAQDISDPFASTHPVRGHRGAGAPTPLVGRRIARALAVDGRERRRARSRTVRSRPLRAADCDSRHRGGAGAGWSGGTVRPRKAGSPPAPDPSAASARPRPRMRTSVRRPPGAQHELAAPGRAA